VCCDACGDEFYIQNGVIQLLNHFKEKAEVCQVLFAAVLFAAGGDSAIGSIGESVSNVDP